MLLALATERALDGNAGLDGTKRSSDSFMPFSMLNISFSAHYMWVGQELAGSFLVGVTVSMSLSPFH